MKKTGIKKPLQWKFEESSCIRCTSHGLNGNGYPAMRRNGTNSIPICRHILKRKYRVTSSAIQSRHTCDHRWCINPDHIIPGTIQQNIADRVERNRTAHNFGMKAGPSKLKDSDVFLIRKKYQEGLTQTDISTLFGIHQTNVHYIVTRKTWPHI